MPLSSSTVCDSGRVYAMQHSAHFESLQRGWFGEYTSTDCFIELLNQKLLADFFLAIDCLLFRNSEIVKDQAPFVNP